MFFNMQHKSNKAHALKRNQGTIAGIDLMIVDIPEGFPISLVSSPPTFVLEWNFDDKNFLAMVFNIGSFLVHHNGVLLFLHKDNLKLEADIRDYSKAYHFSILKEWIGINHLPMGNCTLGWYYKTIRWNNFHGFRLLEQLERS